jgi:hypothetical protein
VTAAEAVTAAWVERPGLAVSPARAGKVAPAAYSAPVEPLAGPGNPASPGSLASQANRAARTGLSPAPLPARRAASGPARP